MRWLSVLRLADFGGRKRPGENGDPCGIHIGQISLLNYLHIPFSTENQIPRFCTPNKMHRISDIRRT